MAQDQLSDSGNLGPEAYLQTLQKKNLEPLWLKFKQPTPLKPNPRAVSCIWKYLEYVPLLRKATEEAEEADRRALLLINPNMTSYHTTDTLHGGLLIVQPGETIPARRHLPYIIRFVIDGEGFTSVDGNKMSMRRGDVIVIPGYQWYDHGNESDAPVIWLDILNLELSSVVPGSYSELFRGSHYSST
ncbi:hypothetical protein K445DRAFT_20291 [Daldinia sp. EC12]|nr:hypothetical protein K445DRAFT_20291 [Daldinia sp. EC12]